MTHIIHHWFFTPSCDGFLSTRIWGQRFIILPMTDPAGAGILMLTWLGYIDGIHGTPYIAYMDPSWVMWFYCLFLHCIPKKYHRTFPISGWFYSPELDTQISQTYQIATNWRYNYPYPSRFPFNFPISCLLYPASMWKTHPLDKLRLYNSPQKFDIVQPFWDASLTIILDKLKQFTKLT